MGIEIRSGGFRIFFNFAKDSFGIAFLKRAFSDDRADEFTHQDDKVLIWVRNFKGCDFLIMKMSRRMNLEGGVW